MEKTPSIEDELLEVARWYTHFKRMDMSVEKRQELHEKAIDSLLWILARTLEELPPATSGAWRRRASRAALGLVAKDGKIIPFSRP